MTNKDKNSLICNVPPCFCTRLRSAYKVHYHWSTISKCSAHYKLIITGLLYQSAHYKLIKCQNTVTCHQHQNSNSITS